MTRTSTRSWTRGPVPPGADAAYTGSVVADPSIVWISAVLCGSWRSNRSRAWSSMVTGLNQLLLSKATEYVVTGVFVQVVGSPASTKPADAVNRGSAEARHTRLSSGWM